MDRQNFSEGLSAVQEDILAAMLAWEIYLESWPTEAVVLVLNSHIDFFRPVRRSLLDSTIVSLGKVFDNDKRTWSLSNLLNYAEKDPATLVPNLAPADLGELRQKLDQIDLADKVEKIKALRDQRVAHHDRTPIPKESTTIGDINDLLELVQNIRNQLQHGHDRSRTVTHSYRERARSETAAILDILNNRRLKILAQA